MKKIKLNKKRQLQIHFNNLFNKKSNYLKNLQNLNTEGIKEIENEKAEILIDKCLGINQFERDYSFFNPPLQNSEHSSREESKKKKLKLFPELKILITSPIERNFPDRYKKKDFAEDDFSNIYKNNNRNNIEKENKLYGSYRSISKNKNSFEKDNEKFYGRNDKKIGSSFLTGVGRHIITESYDKEDLESSIKKRKIFNQIKIK